MYVEFDDIVCIRSLEDNESMIIKIVKSNPNLDNNEISDKSPIGKKLINKNKGEEFVVSLQNGKFITYKVENIEKNIKNLENKCCVSKDDLKLQLLTKFKEYGFKGFIHKTELENLKNIINDKYLYSRNSLKFKNTKFVDRADQGVISNTEYYVKSCCRFYYADDTPTYATANYKRPVELVFDEKLIFSEKAYFSNKNAACKNAIITNTMSAVLDFDWFGIFERGIYTNSSYYYRYVLSGMWSKDKLNEYLTHIRNAEFLIEGKVSIDFIKEIIVECNQDYDELKKICSSDIIKKIRVRSGPF
jgi:hypothetical protein